VPTTNKEYAVAITGSIKNKYTNTGTVSMEPPPPVRPSINPIKIEAIYPAISMCAKMRVCKVGFCDWHHIKS
jgi:hypothetical protein